MFICWTDSLSVNIPVIDDDHRVLIAIINDLHDAVKQECDREVLSPILVRLADYTGEHFLREEQVMRHFGFPRLDAHIAAHEELLNRLAVIINEFERGDAMVTLHTLDLLSDWLCKHVMTADQAFGIFLRQRYEGLDMPDLAPLGRSGGESPAG